MSRNAKKNRNERKLRLESLEPRQMMSASPWQPATLNPVGSTGAAAAVAAPVVGATATQPWYEFDVSKLKVTEGQGYIDITVYRRGVGTQDNDVYWTTRNSTAVMRESGVSQDDFFYNKDQINRWDRVLKFRGDDHVESFRINISNDEITEPTESFKVFLLKWEDSDSRLRDPSPENVLAQASVTIIDDDFGHWEDGGVYVIDGKAGADRLHLTRDAAGRQCATFNGVTKIFQSGIIGVPTVGGIKFNGGDGNDVFINDSWLRTEVNGDGGNDSLTGGTDIDILHGGTGDDKLNGRDGADSLYGDDGNDDVRGGLHNDRIYGGNGDDWVIGDQGSDRVYGENGNDQVYGNDGTDFLYGGQGYDYLFGGAGNDVADGGTEDDHIDGGAGSDKLYGRGGRDVLFGQGGMDWLYGGIGSDELDGGAGDDFVYGEDGNDTIKSQDGVDGNDNLYGGLGTDVFYAPLVEIKQR